MDTIFYFSQKPVNNENLVHGTICEVDIGMPIAYMEIKDSKERYKLSFPWQSRTPHLVECIQECKSFKIECFACENEIVYLSLVIDKNSFIEEIENFGTISGEIHVIGLIMDVWREARVPVFDKEYYKDLCDISECENWNKTYPLFDHQIESTRWMKTIENSSSSLLYDGNIKMSDTGWFVDTENECLTTDPSVREANTRGGILANGTGAGKTATVLYHIINNITFKDTKISINKYISKGNLVIVPVNLVAQWLSEVEKFCIINNIKVVKFYQSKDIKNTTISDLLEADIVLTTLHFLRTSKPYSDVIDSALLKANISGKDSRGKSAFSAWSRLSGNTQPILEAVHWNRVIIDEIHTVFSNPRELRQTKQFSSNFLWGITATPDLVTENAQQLYIVLQREKAHHPNMLKSLITKCVYKRDSGFDWPQTNLNLVSLTAKERIYLQSQEDYLSTTEIIKLCSFVDVSDDIRSCNSKTIEKELKEQKLNNIKRMEANLEEYDKSISILEKASRELEEQITKLSEKESGNLELTTSQLKVAENSAERHTKELTKIRESRDIESSKLERAKRSIDFFTDRLNALQSRSQCCSICQTKKCSVIIPCGHLFCSQCIRKCHKLSGKCPECRQDFDEEKIKGVTLGEMGTKMLEIVKLVESIEDPIILFVQWKSMVRGMKSFLRGMNIKVLSLEGNVTQRSFTLQEFKLGGVLLLCLEDSFAGLHLPHARHVIFSHAIVGDVRNVKLLEEQAIARCVRHGQTEKVMVYSFVVKDCDEETVWKNTHELV